jgi:radical SAM-linked protein
MVVDQSISTPLLLEPAPPVRAKYRIRFRKAGNLRLVSHHDLMHVFERMLRRAELPLCTTQGFHPQPRIVFAQSLALGIAGGNEVVELELKETFPAEEIHARLVRQVPPGMEILSTRVIDFKAGAQVRRAFYRLEIPESMATDLPERCASLMSATEIWVERIRPRPRRFNLRPYLNKLTCAPVVKAASFDQPDVKAVSFDNGNLSLEMAVWVTAYGTLRPEEVARLLGLESLLEHTFFERTFLELHDEVAKDDPEVIPACLLEIPPGSRAPSTITPITEVSETSEVLVAQTLTAQDESFNA